MLFDIIQFLQDHINQASEEVKRQTEILNGSLNRLRAAEEECNIQRTKLKEIEHKQAEFEKLFTLYKRFSKRRA